MSRQTREERNGIRSCRWSTTHWLLIAQELKFARSPPNMSKDILNNSIPRDNLIESTDDINCKYKGDNHGKGIKY